MSVPAFPFLDPEVLWSWTGNSKDLVITRDEMSDCVNAVTPAGASLWVYLSRQSLVELGYI